MQMVADREAANRLQHKMSKRDAKLLKGVTTDECLTAEYSLF